MTSNKITWLEIAVHLFDSFNQGHDNKFPEYDNRYQRDKEEMMKRVYCERINYISGIPGAHLLFVAHTPITKGLLHENAKEVYMHVIDKLSDKHTIFDFSVDEKHLERLRSKVSEEVEFRAWGEFTSGCVLNDLLRTKYFLGKPILKEDTMRELRPEEGVDFEYPLPWEKPCKYEFDLRTKKYKNNVSHNIDYFLGQRDCPIFQ